MKHDNLYRERLTTLILKFQFLEEALRMDIAKKYEFLNNNTNTFPFKYSYKDLNKKPLSRLVEIFIKLSNENQLNKELNKIVETRNKYVHAGYLLSIEGLVNISNMQQRIRNVVSTANKVDKLMRRVLKDIKLVSKEKTDQGKNKTILSTSSSKGNAWEYLGVFHIKWGKDLK